MSEGGRKVWNREQLYALNSGAVFLVHGGSDGKPMPMQIEHYRPAYGETVTDFYEFGIEYGSTEPPESEYPIEVIWEPTEED